MLSVKLDSLPACFLKNIKSVYFMNSGLSEKIGLKSNYSKKMKPLSTVEAVVTFRRNSTDSTLQEIATTLRVSRQRVHQILKKHNLQTRHYAHKISYECPACGNISKHKFCSIECWKKWHQIPVICSYCGKLFTRRQAELLGHHREHLFCSRECLGKWNAKQYGFKSRSKNCCGPTKKLSKSVLRV
jgi:hypothetical protein